MIYKILKIPVLFFLIIVSNNLFSQINVKWKLNLKTQQATVYVHNEGNKKIAFPLDTKSFQAYFSDNYVVSQSEWNKDYPFYSFTINVYDVINNKLIETNSTTPYLDLSDFEKQKANIKLNNKNYNSKIRLWKKMHNLKNDLDAEINYYLMQNLILLEPKEEKSFSIVFNLRNITNKNNIVQDSYVLEKNRDYLVFLSLFVKNDVYNYFTPSQKEKLKKYKFFTGSLESNKIELKE